MNDYDQIIRILRKLSIDGDPIATTYLAQLYNCAPEDRERILLQIRSFANSLNYEVRNVGPSEYKDDTTTQTPFMDYRV